MPIGEISAADVEFQMVMMLGTKWLGAVPVFKVSEGNGKFIIEAAVGYKKTKFIIKWEEFEMFLDRSIAFNPLIKRASERLVVFWAKCLTELAGEYDLQHAMRYIDTFQSPRMKRKNSLPAVANWIERWRHAENEH